MQRNSNITDESRPRLLVGFCKNDEEGSCVYALHTNTNGGQCVVSLPAQKTTALLLAVSFTYYTFARFYIGDGLLL